MPPFRFWAADASTPQNRKGLLRECSRRSLLILRSYFVGTS